MPGQRKSFNKGEHMPHGRNPESDQRKSKIVSDLRQRFGEVCRNRTNRHDWYQLKGGEVEIFITDSKAHFNERPWFDMSVSDIQELANHQSGFIIFVLGEADSYLVIPAAQLQNELNNYVKGRRKLKRGFYHFNLPLPGATFSQLPNFNLMPYRLNLQLIQNAIK